MSKEDEAERKTFGGIIPARPKGARGPTAPPPLDDLLKRRQTMHDPLRDELPKFGSEPDPEAHYQEIPKPPGAVFNQMDPFEAFVEFMRVLRKLPRKQQKAIIEIIADLID